jgi:hypothetical protein
MQHPRSAFLIISVRGAKIYAVEHFMTQNTAEKSLFDRYLLQAGSSLSLDFKTEDGGNIHFRNVGSISTDCTTI